MIENRKFKPHRDLPQLTRVLLSTLSTPLLLFFTVVGNAVMFASAYFFYIVEFEVNENVGSYGDALWWALCTVSTVGYGDVVPQTVPGRFVAAFLIVVGVAFFLGFMAILVSAMSARIAEEELRP